MNWMRRLFTRKQMEAELDKELRFHFESQVADKVHSGIPENEARRLTRIEFGGIEQIKEACRERQGTLWLESIAQDFRYGLRRLRKSPGFSIIVVLTLALGLGANVAMFSLVQGILLRSLPVASPASLYRIGDQTHCCYFNGFEGTDGDVDLFSHDLFQRFQGATEFEQLAAVQAGGGSFSVRWGAAAARAMRTEYVSGNYFTMLGVNAFAGRPLSPSDDKIGAVPVVVLSYSAWQRAFGGNPNAVGATLRLNQHAFVVVGIAPPEFYGDRISPFPPDMWLPLAGEALMEGSNSSLLQPDTAWLYAIGRLRPGVNLGSLQSKLSVVMRQWMGTRPAFTARGGAAEIPKQHVVLSPAGGGIQKIQQQTGTGLRMLMFLSSVVLLIACANIANLMLARSMAQRVEIAVRIGLGATRGRIIRQILTESLILSTSGGASGIGCRISRITGNAGIGVSACTQYAGFGASIIDRAGICPRHFDFDGTAVCGSTGLGVIWRTARRCDTLGEKHVARSCIHSATIVAHFSGGALDGSFGDRFSCHSIALQPGASAGRR